MKTFQGILATFFILLLGGMCSLAISRDEEDMVQSGQVSEYPNQRGGGGRDRSEAVCDQKKEGLERTGVKSKYFYAPEQYLNFDQIASYCKQRNLKMAEVNSLTDVEHLLQFSYSLTPGDDQFMLDYKRNDEGGYSTSNSNPMSFQTFESGTARNHNLRCVMLKLMGREPPKMEQVDCSEVTLTLCQFSADDKCLAYSAQEDEKADEELMPIGMVGEAQFFASETMKNYADAAEFCSASDTTLLDIQSQKVNEKVFALAREFTASLNIDPSTPFLTSGHVINGKIAWDLGSEPMPMPESVNYFWAPGSPQEGRDTCVTFSAGLSNQVDGQVVSTMQSDSCKMPYYFMCYRGDQPQDFVDSKDKEEKRNASLTATVAPPLPEEPITEEPILPPFFTNKNITSKHLDQSEGRLPREKIIPPKPSCFKVTALPSIRVEPKSPMTSEELVELVKFSRDGHIEENTDDIPYKPDSEWRKSLVLLIGNIYRNVCPGGIMPNEYINTIIVLISVYLNSLKQEFVETKVGSQVWEEMMTTLKKCERESTPLSITSKGMFAHEWTDLEDNRISKILIPKEIVDDLVPLNTIIDTFWSMFSLSMGSCMAMADSPSNWAAEYFQNFNMDYLQPLMEAWTTPPRFDLGILIGDFDLEAMNYNVKACTTSAYMRSGIADRQLVRPIDVSGRNLARLLNEKSGQSIKNILT